MPSLASLLLLAATLCAAATAAHADTINFNITGGDGTFAFSLPSTATPTAADSYESRFGLSSATYNGTAVANDAVTFYTVGNNGGFYLSDASGSFSLDEYGPQVFTGTAQHPVFSAGTFHFAGGSAYVGGAASSAVGDTLTITVVPDATPVPEPSTLALLGTGALGLSGTLRRLVQG